MFEIFKTFQGMPVIDGESCRLCAVSKTGNQFVKRFHSVRANKAVPSPYANAFGFAPALA